MLALSVVGAFLCSSKNSILKMKGVAIVLVIVLSAALGGAVTREVPALELDPTHSTVSSLGFMGRRGVVPGWQPNRGAVAYDFQGVVASLQFGRATSVSVTLSVKTSTNWTVNRPHVFQAAIFSLAGPLVAPTGRSAMPPELSSALRTMKFTTEHWANDAAVHVKLFDALSPASNYTVYLINLHCRKNFGCWSALEQFIGGLFGHFIFGAQRKDCTDERREWPVDRLIRNYPYSWRFPFQNFFF